MEKFSVALLAAVLLAGCGSRTTKPPAGSIVTKKRAEAAYFVTVQLDNQALSPEYEYQVTQEEWEAFKIGSRTPDELARK